MLPCPCCKSFDVEYLYSKTFVNADGYQSFLEYWLCKTCGCEFSDALAKLVSKTLQRDD